MKKIDIHCHTTDRKLGPNGKAADVDTIVEKMKEWDIEKTVVLATYFPHRGSGVSNFRLLHWIKDKPEFAMFGSLDFQNYFNQGMNELTELAQMGVLKGVKVYTSYQNIDLHSAKFNRLVGLAKDNALPMMFHGGNSYLARRTLGREAITEIVKASDLEFVAQQNPELEIIVSHLSGDYVDDLVEVVNRNCNVYSDVSGLIDSSSEKDRLYIPEAIENTKEFLHECGPGKLLFGTDFPVQNYEDSVYFVEEAMEGFSAADKQKVYYDNARRLLK